MPEIVLLHSMNALCLWETCFPQDPTIRGLVMRFTLIPADLTILSVTIEYTGALLDGVQACQLKNLN